MNPPVQDFRLTIDGQGFTPGDVTSRVRPRLRGLTLNEQRGGEADQLDLELDDADGRLDLPRLGAEIVLALGWRGQPLVEKGRFKVDERSHAGAPDVVTLRARSADFTAGLKVKRDRSWRQTTLGAVLGQMAGDHGLEAAVDPALAGVEVPLLDQSGRSDSDLLRGLGHAHDAVATVKAGRLIFSPIGKGASPSGHAFEPFVIVRRDGDQHQFREALREGGYSGATAQWHDAAAGERREVHAGGGGERPRKKLRRVHASEADARVAARAEAARTGRAEASFGITLAIGRPEIGPERKGRVRGFKAAADEIEWVVKRATHDWGPDAGGTTALELEKAGQAEA